MTPHWLQLRRRLAVPAVLLLLTHLVGTLGFKLAWGADATWLDALFMTFTTVATIGYGEVHPLDTFGRVVAMVVAAGGIGALFYSFSLGLDFLGDPEVQRARRRLRMERKLDAMAQHVVLAGFGRVGREAARELEASRTQLVVIDPDPSHETSALERGHAFLCGDAADDAVLRRAGIARARSLVVTADSDATNLYVILSARLLNPGLFIVSRAVEEATIPKLMRAGANRAISPYAIGGKRLAHLLQTPGVVDFFETTRARGTDALTIGDIEVVVGAVAAGKTLGALNAHERTGAWLLAVLREGNVVVHPRDDLSLAIGDHVLALGTGEQLALLQRLVTPS